MNPQVPRHRVVAIGASAGGVDALRQLTGALPDDFPAALLIVLHVGEISYLPDILGRTARLPVAAPKSGEPIQPGRIYVAPPGLHMLVHDGHIVLRRGPRENLARPAIDPLFRSAACSYGANTVGAVLTGSLGDGAAGLQAIKRCGGIAVVQDPADAAVPDMPRNAMQKVDVDHRVPLADLPGLLTRLAAYTAGETPEIPEIIRLEAAIAFQESVQVEDMNRLGALSPFTCPDCHGPLWQIHDHAILRYRCHVGHAITAEEMLSAQGDEVEEMIERLKRVHQQRSALVHRMADRDLAKGRHASAEALRKRALEYASDAALMARLLDRRSETDLVEG
jgi:two-component system, chemotaxis family, protein-glutamate methylesterase/glutaminase